MYDGAVGELRRMIKSECTPEQWERRLASMRERRAKNLEAERERYREYNARPEQVAKRKAKRQSAEAKEAERERYHARRAAGKIAKRERTPEEHAIHVAKKKAAWYTPDRVAAKEAREREREATAEARKERDRLWRVAYARKRNTNFTQEDYDYAMKKQGGKCAICASTLRLHADHNHVTGRPRGILCQKCNMVEGVIFSLGFSPKEFGEKLQLYLDKPTIA